MSEANLFAAVHHWLSDNGLGLGSKARARVILTPALQLLTYRISVTLSVGFESCNCIGKTILETAGKV